MSDPQVPLKQLNHIGIYVRSIDEAAKIYERLGCAVERVVRFSPAAGVEIPIAFIPLAGGVDLELIEAPGALDRGAEPLHHICFEVSDLAGTLQSLAAEGVPLANTEPRPGAAAKFIAFLEPAAANGVRIELAEL